MTFADRFFWQNGRGPYCGIFGHSFIRRLCSRWRRGCRTADALPWSGEAYGTGGLGVEKMQHLLRYFNLAKFDCIFIQIGENDMLNYNNRQLLHAMMRVYEECRQGVRHVRFGTLFPRHQRRYNKLRKRLNKILLKMHPDRMWVHQASLMENTSLSLRDGVHLNESSERDFVVSIAEALQSCF